ncbi:MAG TPA: hypothetical protein DCQ30_12485, partial [Acidimicrobiaceae bacterium]|nr:hypothetical protein [Acidimicrobiaceae bacterium]
AYGERYRPVAERAGFSFPTSTVAELKVVERVPGSATTDFGAPGAIAEVDRRPLSAAAARRQAALVEACWAAFDEVVATAPSALRKGPRGGGRDLGAIVAHVLDAERAYLRKLGLRLGPFNGDEPDSLKSHRPAVLKVLGRAWRPSAGDPPWTAPYGARRIAWHVLDHAWEIEDRSEPGA